MANALPDMRSKQDCDSPISVRQLQYEEFYHYLIRSGRFPSQAQARLFQGSVCSWVGANLRNMLRERVTSESGINAYAFVEIGRMGLIVVTATNHFLARGTYQDRLSILESAIGHGL